MKIMLVNGSPKKGQSASKTLLAKITKLFGPSSQVQDLHLHGSHLEESTISLLQDADTIVFAFPLYVDSLPANLLSNLCQLEKRLNGKMVYAIANCGFIEGIQNKLALQIVANWCEKSGNTFGGGLGIGGGGALVPTATIPLGKGPLKVIGLYAQNLVNAIEGKQVIENTYTRIGFPDFAYKFMAESNWKSRAHKNKLKTKDIDKKL